MGATWPADFEVSITIAPAEITVAKGFKRGNASTYSIRWFMKLAPINHGVIKAIAGNRH
jgi:hypothetical protein